MTFQNLNRKTHIYLGLFLLLFIWLFSLSGLILNHGNWKFTSFWEERVETTEEFEMDIADSNGFISLDRVLDFLSLEGEVQIQKKNPALLEFRVESPGLVNDVQVDITTGKGKRKQLKYNAWGKLRGLHTFNGIIPEARDQTPYWFITNLWRFAMDGVAIGLIIICVSSWVMWYNVRQQFKLGYLTILISFLLAGYFLLLGFL